MNRKLVYQVGNNKKFNLPCPHFPPYSCPWLVPVNI